MQSKALSKMCLSLLEQEKGWGQQMLHGLADNGWESTSWEHQAGTLPDKWAVPPNFSSHLASDLSSLQRAPGFYFWVYGTKSNTRCHPIVFGWIKETRDGKHESHIQLSTSMNWNFYFSAPECPQRAYAWKPQQGGHLDVFSSSL